MIIRWTPYSKKIGANTIVNTSTTWRVGTRKGKISVIKMLPPIVSKFLNILGNQFYTYQQRIGIWGKISLIGSFILCITTHAKLRILNHMKAVLSGNRDRFGRFVDKTLEEACSLVREIGNQHKNVSQGILILNVDGFNLIQHGCLQCELYCLMIWLRNFTIAICNYIKFRVLCKTIASTLWYIA